MSEQTIKRRARVRSSMGRVTPDFVHAELTAASKAHLFCLYTSFYNGETDANLRFVYDRGRDFLECAVASFVDEQDALLGVASPREQQISEALLDFAMLTDDDLRLLHAQDVSYLRRIKDVWRTQRFDGVRKPDWPRGDQPYCNNRGGQRTVYDYNRRLLIPELRSVSQKLERALDTDELWSLGPVHKRISETFVGSYEGHLKGSVNVNDYRG